MATLRYEFRLFGPRKGETGVISGHRFVEGTCVKVVSSEVADGLIRVLSYYGAYAKGTPAYDEALAKEEAANGAGEVHADPGSGTPDAVPGDVQSEGGGPAEVSADERSAADGAEGGGPEVRSAGSGQSDAGVPKFEEAADLPEPSEPASVGSDEVKAAILKLDPDVDEHWVQTGAHKGKPKLSAVEDAYGKAGLTRQDLESALPGWSRDKAVEAALDG